MDIKTFVESNARPQVSAVDLASLDYRTVTDIKSMTAADVTGGSFAIVCDNPKWAAQSINEKGDIAIFSSDGTDYVYTATTKRTSFLRYELSNGKLTLAQTQKFVFTDEEIAQELKLIKTNKEATPMANDLDAIMNQAAEEVKEGAIKPMTGFGDAEQKQVGGRKAADPEAKAQKQADREKAEALRKKIRDEVNAAQDQQVDMSIVEASWKQNAQLICFIPPTDRRQSIAAVKVPVKGANRELVDNAPDDVRAIYLKNPASVSADWIKTSYEIKARESKPGKAVGVIARIPAFLKDCSAMDYVKNISIEKAKTALQENDNSTVIELVTINDFEQKLTFVGGSIMEAPETAPENGKPGEVKILYGQPNSNAVSSKGVLKDQGVVFAKKIVKVGQGNKTPMHDRNYFPLTTYETIDITKPMPADVVADLNRFTFENLFTPAKNSKQVGVKYNNLVDSDRVHITKKGDDIASDYITNESNRVDLTTTAFYDKAQARPTITLPLKRRNPKPDGTLGAPQFVKYNCTLEDKMADPEYRAKSALGRPEFAHIVDVVGEELLAPSILKEKFKRSGGSGSVSKYLGADIARDLLMVKMRGGLDNYMISGFSFE